VHGVGDAATFLGFAKRKNTPSCCWCDGDNVVHGRHITIFDMFTKTHETKQCQYSMDSIVTNLGY
jgi:hypothetical protein